MNKRTPLSVRYSITIAAGTIVYLAVGWLVFGVLLGPYSDQHTTQLPGFKKDEAHFSWSLLIVSCMAYAALITYINITLARLTGIWKSALSASLTGVLVAVMADSYWLASSNFYTNPMAAVADVAGAAISVGVLGLSVMLVWRFFS